MSACCQSPCVWQRHGGIELAVVGARQALGMPDHVRQRDVVPVHQPERQRAARRAAAAGCRGSTRRSCRRARSRSPSSSARRCGGRSSSAGRAGRSCRRGRSRSARTCPGSSCSSESGASDGERVPGRRERRARGVVLDDHVRLDEPPGARGRSGASAYCAVSARRAAPNGIGFDTIGGRAGATTATSSVASRNRTGRR